jgi:hypothetical protein
VAPSIRRASTLRPQLSGGNLAVASLVQLTDQPRLFVLLKAAGDLAHHRA